MPGFNNKQTADAYTNGLTIDGVEGSNGGSADIQGANVFYALEGPILGSWTEDTLARPGTLQIYPGTMGIRFKSAVAGSPATVSARIAGKAEPLAQVSASASAATAPGDVLTGIVASNGTIVAGSGFTVNRTGVGTYVVAYTPPFAARPVVVGSVVNSGNSRTFTTQTETASGCTVITNAGASDEAFNFLVQGIV